MVSCAVRPNIANPFSRASCEALARNATLRQVAASAGRLGGFQPHDKKVWRLCITDFSIPRTAPARRCNETGVTRNKLHAQTGPPCWDNRETRGNTMKKVLFATSALVLAFAGAASAEVAVTGDAKLGMRYDSDLVNGTGGTDSAWNVVNRARVKFTMTGQTDSGLEFGASLRADQASTGASNTGIAGSAYKGIVWASGTYGKISVGDTDAAIVNAVGHLPYVGVTELDDLNEFYYNNSDLDTDLGGRQEATLLYEYTINGVKLFASFQDQYYQNTAEKRDTNAWSLGAAYEVAGWELGAGYERGDVYRDPLTSGYLLGLEDEETGVVTRNIGNVNTWAISAAGTVGGFKVKGLYSRTDATVFGPNNDVKVNQYGLGAEYKLANDVQLAGFWRRVDNDNVVLPGASILSGQDGKADVFGLGAGYDLGGGAMIKGGVVHVKTKDGYDGIDRTMADFGLDFKF
ncbi:MAG: hypothetical protein DI498_00735 [Paracoccus denitrificans]|nr:MAG: hypothetical protein DI498_00735 [Paracoccus denitrificans]PZO86289.1 MAG: hypothetical protein DI633_00735 [Paracoccus denitrificans]